MVLERPSLEPGSTLDNALWTSEVAFTGVFGAECLLKMLAYTATFYVTDWRNDVDLAIVVTSLLSLTLETAVKDVRAVRSLRVLRAMKPLRAVTRSAGMQVVLRSMVLSIAAVSNVTLVLLLFLVVFAILGVQLFGGAFKTCTDEAVATEASCVGTYVGRDGVELERRWGLHTVYHFDNIGNALLLLFVFATQDGYSDILTRMMVATGSWSVIYFFVVAVVVSFSLLSLFIGVIFFNFTRLKLFSDMGSVFLSARQREWVEINKVMLATKPLVRSREAGAPASPQC